MNPWYVYIVECSDKTLYTGITNNLSRRLDEHNHTTLGAKYTKGRRPVTLTYSCAMPDKSTALKEEFRIKNLSKKSKIALAQRPAS